MVYPMPLLFSMRNKFCIKCGTEKNLVNELCLDCFKEETSLLKDLKEIKVVICDSCNKYMNRNSWREGFSKDPRKNIKKIVSEFIENKTIISSDAEIKEMDINVDVNESAKFTNGSLLNVEAKLDVIGTIGNVELEEGYTIPLKIRFSTCNICKKKGANYYEAKIQIRPKNERVLKFIKSYCKTKNLFISKIVEEKYGYDVYLSAQKEARNLGNLLKRKFKGELTESKKIFGKRDGQDIFRATIVLRLEE